MPGGRRGPISRGLQELAGVRRAVAHDRPLSSDEALNVAEGISRRAFLNRAAAVGGGVVLSTSAASALTSRLTRGVRRDAPRVVIVGAGLAGMSAAYWLTRAGVPVRLHEAQRRLGGRCWSARDFEGGQIGEHGGEFIDTRHVHTRRLAGQLGLELDDLYEESASGRSPTFVDGELVKRADLFAELDGAIARLVELAAANGPFFAGEAGPDAVAFDRLTMADWIEENVPGGAGSPVGRLFAAEQTGWWGADPDALSATNLVDFFAVDYPGADERYTVHEGNDLIISRIAEELPEGTVESESVLESVRRRSDERYELGFAGATTPVVADHVILALPFTTLRDVDVSDAGFSAPKLAAIRDLGMGTNAKVLLQFSEPFPMGRWSGVLYRGDAPSFSTWESGVNDGRAAADLGLLTAFSGGRLGASYIGPAPHGPAPSDVTDSTLAAIDAVVPGVSTSFDGRAWLDAWHADPFVHGSYAAFSPGQHTRYYGLMGDSEGNVHFAGEHTSVTSQGFLDGGVESGDRAAVEVLDALGTPVPAALAATVRAAKRFRPDYPW